MTSGSDNGTFSLFDGGPFPVIREGLGVARPDAPKIGRTLAAAVLFTWVPLIVLGTLHEHGASVLRDAAVHARFLIALPLLLVVPALIRDRLRALLEHFSTAGLIKESAAGKFISYQTSAMKLRDSRVAEIAALGLAYAWAVFYLIVVVPQLPTSWRIVEGASRLSAAGWWLVLVSQPVYIFVMTRFLYRMGLWWRFLRQVSRLDLNLRAAHADGAAGLGFLGLSLSAFAVPCFAVAASVAGGLANFVLWGGLSVSSYKYPILTFVLALGMLFAGPLCFFVRALSDAKRQARLKYGSLAAQQLAEFEETPLDGGLPQHRNLLNAPAFSAVRALQSTVAQVYRVRTFPFEKTEFLRLLVIGFLPFLPVAALEIPLKDLLTKLAKMVF